jgi:hypothetical protein
MKSDLRSRLANEMSAVHLFQYHTQVKKEQSNKYAAVENRCLCPSGSTGAMRIAGASCYWLILVYTQHQTAKNFATPNSLIYMTNLSSSLNMAYFVVKHSKFTTKLGINTSRLIEDRMIVEGPWRLQV